MSNGICKRQNEAKCIMMLAAQRELYNSAARLDLVGFVLSVILPVTFSFLPGFGASWDWIRYLSYGLSVLMLFASNAISRACKSKKSLAASIQNEFDIYVYQMPWSKNLFGPRKNLNAEIAEYSQKILNNEKQKGDLVNWFTSPVDDMPLEKGILSCQRENINWDSRLRKRYRIYATILCVFLTVSMYAMGIVNNETFQICITRIVFVLPMARWIITLWNSVSDDIVRLQDLKASFNSIEDLNMEELQANQKRITDHRKSCVKIPNWFYWLFKDKDENREYSIANIERRL